MRFVVFDCDGTLVDSQYAVVAATELALSAYNLPIPSRETSLSLMGYPVDFMMRQHAPDVDTETLNEIVKIYRAEAARLATLDDRGQVLFPGTMDIINWLSQQDDVVLGIITMKSGRGLGRVVDVYGLRPFFECLKSADDGPGKPEPDLLLDAMRQVGALPSETVMIGDTAYDMMMARSANVYAVGVSWGHQTPDELIDGGANEVVETSDRLQDTLKTFLA